MEEVSPPKTSKKLWIAIASCILVAVLLAVALLLLLGMGSNSYTATVKAQGTKVLSEPSLNGQVIAELQPGTKVLVTEEVSKENRTYARIEYTPSQEQVGQKTVVGYVPVQDIIKEKSVDTVEVPSFTGLDKAGAEAKAKKEGITLELTYARSYRTGKEEVVSQKPEAGMHAVKGNPVTAVLDDKDMASAMQDAEQKIGEANAALADIQALGIDTSDLAQPMQTAQARHDTAKTITDLTGPTESSVYFANLVIQSCGAKKQEYLARKAEEERKAREAAEKARRQVIQFSQYG